MVSPLVDSYFVIFVDFFEHITGEALLDLVHRKGTQIFAVIDIDDVTNASKFIGRILNGNVNYLVVEFEPIVDDL